MASRTWDGSSDPGRAGRAAGTADSLHIQHHQEGLTLDELEAEVGVGRKPVGADARSGVLWGTSLNNALNQMIPQLASHMDVRSSIVCNGDFHGFAEADDARHIFRSRPALASPERRHG